MNRALAQLPETIRPQLEAAHFGVTLYDAA